MALQQITYVDLVETTKAGPLQVRLKKSVFNGEKEIGFEYHRTAIEPGIDPWAVYAVVNDHLISMGAAPVEEADWTARVADLVPIVHSEKTVADWTAAQAAQAAQAAKE